MKVRFFKVYIVFVCRVLSRDTKRRQRWQWRRKEPKRCLRARLVLPHCPDPAFELGMPVPGLDSAGAEMCCSPGTPIRWGRWRKAEVQAQSRLNVCFQWYVLVGREERKMKGKNLGWVLIPGSWGLSWPAGAKMRKCSWQGNLVKICKLLHTGSGCGFP